MAMHASITPEQAELIRSSHLFFIASVHPELTDGPAGEGPVNVSPKGATPLHVLDDHRVAYVDFHGSGNESARHAAADGPCTVMVMSMDRENAAIVRLYGRARAASFDESPLADQLLGNFQEHLGRGRQIIQIDVERTQTSCGYGVPMYEYVGERTVEERGRRFKEPKAPSPTKS